MPLEFSAGVIIFRNAAGGREYLLLVDDRGRWDSPKGHIEKGETARQAALREAGEEAGLRSLELVEGFTHKVTYFFSKGGRTVRKTVTFFLGRSPTAAFATSSEHAGGGWFSFDEAMARLKFLTARQALQAAEDFLNSAPGR